MIGDLDVRKNYLQIPKFRVYIVSGLQTPHPLLHNLHKAVGFFSAN